MLWPVSDPLKQVIGRRGRKAWQKIILKFIQQWQEVDCPFYTDEQPQEPNSQYYKEQI